MRISSHRLIRLDFQDNTRQWFAAFDDAVQVAFEGEFSMTALRRLLEGTEAHPGHYELRADRPHGSPLLRVIDWRPPEIRFPCEHCAGLGTYTGLLEVERCSRCQGNGYLLTD
jgi:hypothetical protein